MCICLMIPNFSRKCLPKLTQIHRIHGLMVRIVAFQAIGSGSIPDECISGVFFCFWDSIEPQKLILGRWERKFRFGDIIRQVLAFWSQQIATTSSSSRLKRLEELIMSHESGEAQHQTEIPLLADTANATRSCDKARLSHNLRLNERLDWGVHAS